MSVKNKVTRISRCIIYRVIFHSEHFICSSLSSRRRRGCFSSGGLDIIQVFGTFDRWAQISTHKQHLWTDKLDVKWLFTFTFPLKSSQKMALLKSMCFPLPWLYDALKQPLTESCCSAAPCRLWHILRGCYFRVLRVDWLQIERPWNRFPFTRVWRPLHHQLALFWDHRYVRYSQADGALSQSTLAPQSITGRCWNSRSFVLII